MKYIISYCSGGIGNRLLPLSSCFELSSNLSRELGMVWNKTDICFANFESLFKNNISKFDLNELNPEEVSIYTNEQYIIDDFKMYKNPGLYDLYKKTGTKNLSNLKDVYQDDKKYIIIYDNNFFLNLNNVNLFLIFLKPVDTIINIINEFKNKHDLSDQVLGVHARGTDFIDEKLDDYIIKIKNFIIQNRNCKILFCSDSYKWESKIANLFPQNVIVRKKMDYTRRTNFLRGWSNNAHRSENSVIEGIIDIYLLSNTNLVVYNEHSTFAQLVKHLITLRNFNNEQY